MTTLGRCFVFSTFIVSRRRFGRRRKKVHACGILLRICSPMALPIPSPLLIEIQTGSYIG